MGSDAHWRPGSYPFDPARALAIYQDFKNMDTRDLEISRMSKKLLANAENAGLLEEMEALASFSGQAPQGNRPSGAGIKERIMLEQAQKTLIWIWLQEERVLEINNLLGKTEKISSLLAGNFLENDAARVSPLEIGAAAAGKDESRDSAVFDFSLLPSWRTVLANAAIFIPCETAIWAQGEMAVDLADTIEFKDEAKREKGRNIFFSIARAPLWQALGRRAPWPENEPMSASFNQERIWLIWRN